MIRQRPRLGRWWRLVERAAVLYWPRLTPPCNWLLVEQYLE